MRRLLAAASLAVFFLVPGATAARAGDTLNVRVAPRDSLGRPMGRLSQSGSLQRLLAEADSMLKLRGGVHAESTQLFIAWDAPWGTRRAKAARVPVCGDTTGADTLYLSFYPGRFSRGFMGFSAVLHFHATGSDTLGPWWHMESKGGENGGNLQVEFGPAETMPGVQPWAAPGQGFALLDRTSDDVRLRTIFAVSVTDARPIAPDSIYTLCRVILRHRRSGRLAGCGQPVCVEWTSAKFGFALKDEPEVRRGERFVSYGAGATACEESRGPAVPVWKPPAPARPK